jgi:hypothetical protein
VARSEPSRSCRAPSRFEIPPQVDASGGALAGMGRLLLTDAAANYLRVLRATVDREREDW